MAPGIDDGEIDRVSVPLGLVLPEELRRLFRWRNGSSLSDIVWRRGLFTLAHCVQSTLGMRDESDDDFVWPFEWVQIMNEKPYLAADCRGDHDAPVPIWHFDYEFEYPTRPVFASIGDMVTFWIETIDSGEIYWSGHEGLWRAREPLAEDVAQRYGGVPSD